ncbi:N4-gp56 family major capsid protein [Neptunomonas sp. XY-337]|uniref:N4-gp56 family major capsid protein n=1 Tax=Neptunomonas sp. XY-337 TaxID=2561897 RepID=UPI0010A99903|nr:N4-gp56 family major capsid protein [Neptunomonas sp. XY-337]
MPQTTYGSISQRTAAWAAADMLKHAEPVMILSKFGQHKPIPTNTANAVKFRRAIPFPVATAGLQEGVTPASRQIQFEDVEATLVQYGDVAEITDHVQDMAEDPVLKVGTELCGEQAGATIEAVTWGAIRAGTSVYYANGNTRSGVNQPIKLKLQRAVTAALKRNKAKKVTKMASSSVKYGTEAIAAAYIAVAHTNLESDIRDMPGFTPVEKYGTTKPLPYEIGKVEDVRYVLSPDLDAFLNAGGAAGNMVSDSGTNADVYPVIYFGQDAYGCIPLKGKKAITPKVTPVEETDSSDPLGQRGYVGWKSYFVAKILNEGWIVRLEVAATDNMQ